jgi:hypothetical protein
LGCEILCVQSSISQLRILGLTVNSTPQIRDLNILTSIQDYIKLAQSDRDRQRIVQWLSKSVPDSSQEHNAARQKHEENTGSWSVNSQEMKTWAHSSNILFLVKWQLYVIMLATHLLHQNEH